MPDRMPEDMSDRMPEDLPVTKCINVMVGITRSKVILIYFDICWDILIIVIDKQNHLLRLIVKVLCIVLTIAPYRILCKSPILQGTVLWSHWNMVQVEHERRSEKPRHFVGITVRKQLATSGDFAILCQKTLWSISSMLRASLGKWISSCNCQLFWCSSGQWAFDQPIILISFKEAHCYCEQTWGTNGTTTLVSLSIQIYYQSSIVLKLG